MSVDYSPHVTGAATVRPWDATELIDDLSRKLSDLQTQLADVHKLYDAKKAYQATLPELETGMKRLRRMLTTVPPAKSSPLFVPTAEVRLSQCHRDSVKLYKWAQHWVKGGSIKKLYAWLEQQESFAGACSECKLPKKMANFKRYVNEALRAEGTSHRERKRAQAGT
jgi:hypothetical protein